MPTAQPCQGKGLTTQMVTWKLSIFWSMDEQLREASTQLTTLQLSSRAILILMAVKAAPYSKYFFTMKNIRTHQVLNIYAKQTINNSFTQQSFASFEMHQCFYQYRAMDLHCTEKTWRHLGYPSIANLSVITEGKLK